MTTLNPSTRTNETKTTVNQYSNVDVVVNYFWDDHDRLICWDAFVESPKRFYNANVKIVKYSFTENIGESTFNMEALQLFVNDQCIPGDVVGTTLEKDNKLICHVVVGWG